LIGNLRLSSTIFTLEDFCRKQWPDAHGNVSLKFRLNPNQYIESVQQSRAQRVLLAGFGLKAESRAGGGTLILHAKPEFWIDALENLVGDIHRSMWGAGFSASLSTRETPPSSAQHLGAGRKPQIHFGLTGDASATGRGLSVIV
jgi:hypothetical protein